jgi:hypothetical protein
MLTEARKEVISGLEDGYINDADAYAANERRKFMALPQSYRAAAKKALKITTEDRELTVEEVDMLKLWIDVNKELDDSVVKEF